MKKNKFLQKLSALVLVVFFTTSCADEFIDTTSTLNLQGEQIVDAASAQNALIGMYNDLQDGDLWSGSTTYLLGMWTDELIHGGSFPTFAQVAGNDPNSENVTISNTWNGYYNAIFAANNLIENINASIPNMTQGDVDNIRGQAYGVRALCYFQLVRIFGGVPIELTPNKTAPDLDSNNTLPRSSAADVYTQIQSDITSGTALLRTSGATRSINRFSLGAILTLSGQVHMQLGLYPAAQTALEEVTTLGYSLDDFGNLYGTAALGARLSSTETIFGNPFNATDGSGIAFFFSDQPDGGRDEVRPSATLTNAFEAGDIRANGLVSPTGRARVAKYTQAGTGDDDVHVMRYADVLLMLAELYARIDDPRADTMINLVRTRAELPDISGLDSSNFVAIIAQERLVEFYAEGGDRYHTTKRLGLLDAIVQAKGGAFVAARQNLFPIPQNEIDNNAGMSESDQNPGY